MYINIQVYVQGDPKNMDWFVIVITHELHHEKMWKNFY